MKWHKHNMVKYQRAEWNDLLVNLYTLLFIKFRYKMTQFKVKK